MPQTKFKENVSELPEGKKSEFHEVIKNIYGALYQEVNNKLLFEQLINGRVLERADTNLRKAPEDLTKEIIIKPLFKFLGFKEEDLHRETASGSTIERRAADYTLIIGDERILVEAEPLNKDLNLKGSGIEQVGSWLEKRSFRADYGIATNGFTWVLLKYDSDDYKLKRLVVVELKGFFQEILGQSHLTELKEIINEFYSGFSHKYILSTAKDRATFLEEKKEKITRRFYEDYIRYVFGYDKRTKSHTYCLLDAISPPTSLIDSENIADEKRLFSVNLMSRLIFIKFLEDKGLVQKNLLLNMFKEYNKSNIPAKFYKTYLQTLFYEVFNTPLNQRGTNVNRIEFFKKIPYLNGGLFREIVPKEVEYDVNDDIVKEIIEKVLEGYSFTLDGEGDLNPDILGNVFEKTINYITGDSLDDENDKRKEKGAYYTPEEVTSFISKNTIHPVIFENFKSTLKQFEWKDVDINAYKSLTDFLENPPNNPKILKALYNTVNEIKILDPACGSGHFLTSAMKELIFIKKRLLEQLDQEINYYHIKKQIVRDNLYGVDIENSAIEIAKLRLWLSLIENLDLSDISQIETLPNIEYKIIDGNSLIGWVNEEISQNVAISPYDERIQGIFEGLLVTDDSEKFNLLSESQNLLRMVGGEGVRLVENWKQAYAKLQVLYSQEEGGKAVRLRDILVTIRRAIYSVVSTSFQKYIIDKSSFKRKNTEDIVKKYTMLNQFHWNIDFGEMITKGGFDVIIGNPPYGIEISETEKRYISLVLPFTKEYVNSALAFIERSYYLVRKNGYVGLIVPKSLAYSQKWSIGRKLVKDDLDTIVDVSSAFKDVKLEQVIIILKKGNASKEYMIKDVADITSFNVDKEYIGLTDTLLVHANEADLEIFKKLNSSNLFLKNISETGRGLPFQNKVTITKTNYPVYRGGDISRYNLRETSEYLPDEFIDAEKKSIKFLQQPKILSQRIVAHVKRPQPHIIIMSTVDRKGVLTLDTVENTVLTDNEYPLEFLTCLLNSRLIAWYVYRYVFSKAIRTMDLDDYYIRKIPLPNKAKTLDDFSVKYNEMEKAQVQQNTNEIEMIESEINSLIYSLYNLDEKEIEIIDSDFINKGSECLGDN